MDAMKRGAVAVIFASLRNRNDAAGYDAAASAMDAKAARQPGYIGMEAVRDASGEGITISYWESEEAARAWRAHAEHSAIRERGRSQWYDRYRVIVAEVTRSYTWGRSTASHVEAETSEDATMADITPEDTTGAPMLATTPPTPAEAVRVPADTGPDEALVESTSVQGAEDDEA